MESGAATRGGKTRAEDGQSLNNRRTPRNGTTEVDTAALNRLLTALVSMRDGNFRKRLTVSGDGVMSEIAAVFNEVADRNLHLTGELSRVRRVVGREGKLTERLESGACEGSWGAAIDASNALVDDLVRPVSRSAGCCPRWRRAICRRVWNYGRRRRTATGIRCAGVPEGRTDGQQPGRPAVDVHRRGHAGGQRGGHRGQTGRAGPGAWNVRFVEGPHGFGQHHGVPADGSGT